MTTRKTFQRPSRHILRMALLAVSPWFDGSDILAQGTSSPPTMARPTTPRDGLNAVAKPQLQVNSQNSVQQQFNLPPPPQVQNLPTHPAATQLGGTDARLQIYDIPLEYVGELGARIQTQFGSDKRVRITNEPNSGRLMVLAPDGTQKQIAQVVEAAIRQVGGANVDLRGNVIPTSIQQNQYKLQRISWRELEDAVGRIAGPRLTISTSNNGELAQLKLVSKDSVQEVMQVDRRNNEVRLQGTSSVVMGWTQVITAIDLGQADPARPTQIIPITPATPERIERAIKLVKLASYQQPAQQPPQEEETVGTAQIGPGSGNDRATIVASPDAISAGSGLIGEVDISFVTEMGLVIIKGSKRDVQRVQEVIEQIKKQSVETQPEIEVVPLKHVNGERLEVILKALNTEVFSPRQGQISITALGQPNALLLIGRKEAMGALREVIDKLDTPIDPNSQLRVFKLTNASAVDAQATIEAFFGVPPAAAAANQAATTGGLTVRVKAVADFRTNSLIVQASPRDQAEVARLIADIDSDSSPAESEIKIFPIRFAIASELQPILSGAINGTQAATTGANQQQQQQQGGGAAAGTAKVPSSQLTIGSNSGLLTGVVVNSSPTINALIVRAPSKSMPLIKALIEQLDIPSGVEARIKVFEVKNGDATTLATALQQAFGLPTTQQTNTANTNVGLGGLFGLNQAAISGGAESSLVPLRIATETRTNSIIVSGSKADLEVIEALYLRLDEDNAKQRTLEVIWLRNSSATDVATAVTNLITSQRTNLQAITAPVGQAGQATGSIYSVIERTDREVYVIPEANTNSLIISAMPRYLPMIRQVIERLDRQQPMISVEILIAEVTLDDQFDLGTEFGLQDSLLFDRNSASGGTLTSPAFNVNATPLSITTPAAQQRRTQNVAGMGTSGFGLGRSNASLGYGGLVLAAGSESVNMLFRALQDANRVQILSRPHLMTIDNNIANVQVGSLVPRFQGSIQGISGTQQNITDTPVGLIMQIQPRTNQDGLINMIVAVTRSSLGPTDSGVPVGFSVNGDVIRSPVI
ncbi:MAG TPA: secretin N-terminal domain-containing protein, partial [Pirellula sp.]|nr:secretin N-terminal domain-containing protein [Pirellula sp.]